MRLCVSGGAVEGTGGGRPTSRGLPFLGTGRRKLVPKRDSQGTGPLGGCGQSPPVSRRDGLGNETATGRVKSRDFAGEGSRCWVHAPDVRREKAMAVRRACKAPRLPRGDDAKGGWSGEGRAPFAGGRASPSLAGQRATAPLLGAPVNSPDGENAWMPCFLPRYAKDPARHSAAPLPAGQTASPPHTGSAPCPAGQGSVAQRAADGRPLLVGRPPSLPTAAPSETKRSAQAPCSWGLGASTRSRRHWPPAPPARRALPP